jgi:hypothetical protein
MPQIVTTTQLNQYLVRLQSGNVNTAINIYGDLLSKGYNYAGWAQGVATGNSITGQSALDFLSGTALMGLGGESCKNLSESQLNPGRLHVTSLDRMAVDRGERHASCP